MQQPMARHCTLNNFPDSTDLVHKALARPDSLASFSRLNLMQPPQPITHDSTMVTNQHFIAAFFIAVYAYIQEASG